MGISEAMKRQVGKHPIYNLLSVNPPIDQKTGRRRIGSSSWDAYWRGYDGKPCIWPRTSATADAWRAGRDARRR